MIFQVPGSETRDANVWKIGDVKKYRDIVDKPYALEINTAAFPLNFGQFKKEIFWPGFHHRFAYDFCDQVFLTHGRGGPADREDPDSLGFVQYHTAEALPFLDESPVGQHVKGFSDCWTCHTMYRTEIIFRGQNITLGVCSRFNVPAQRFIYNTVMGNRFFQVIFVVELQI